MPTRQNKPSTRQRCVVLTNLPFLHCMTPEQERNDSVSDVPINVSAAEPGNARFKTYKHLKPSVKRHIGATVRRLFTVYCVVVVVVIACAVADKHPSCVHLHYSGIQA